MLILKAFFVSRDSRYGLDRNTEITSGLRGKEFFHKRKMRVSNTGSPLIRTQKFRDVFPKTIFSDPELDELASFSFSFFSLFPSLGQWVK